MRFPLFWRRQQPLFRSLSIDWARDCSLIHSSFFARPWDPDEISDLLRDSAVFADGAFDSRARTLLGFVISRAAPPDCEVLTIAVSRRHQGKGIANALLMHHLGRLRDAGISVVFLEVEQGNLPATALYRRMGFVEVGQRPGYYRKTSGASVAALVMRLDLAQ